MDTARIRWTVRHKQHIRQEACFLGNRFIPPHSALSRPVWPIKQTLRIYTDTPTKKAPCKPVNATVKNNRIIYGKSRPGLLRSSDAQGGFLRFIRKKVHIMASEIRNRFTDTEMQIARETDLPELLSHLGDQVKRVGRFHTTAEVDSLRIKDRRTWFRYSQNTGGDTITFLQ